MANAKLICKCHKEYQPRESLFITPRGKFCSYELMREWCDEQTVKRHATAERKVKAAVNKKAKAQKVKDKAKKKELITRSQWYQKLQVVVNRYVKWRDRDKACCTCSTCGDHLKYDAGHYIAVGKNIDLRFELTNIHLQCSVKCNQFGRGMPVEYGEFIKAVYGVGHYNWLHTKFLCHKPHPTLKEQFPTTNDIELEVKRYQQLLLQ